MAEIPILFVDNLPVDGELATAVNGVIEGALFLKRNGYNCVDLAINSAADHDFAIYRYNRHFAGWRQEGPRGTTPTTFGPSNPSDIPIRISVPEVAEYLCVVQIDEDPDGNTASLTEANR